jgi:hypothetical protein
MILVKKNVNNYKLKLNILNLENNFYFNVNLNMVLKFMP